jgi:hypothetical protein
MTLKTISAQTQLFLHFLGGMPATDIAAIEAGKLKIEFTLAPVARKGRKVAVRKPMKTTASR